MVALTASAPFTLVPGTTLFEFLRWDDFQDYRTHCTTQEAAEAAVAAFVRANWDDVRHRRRGPETHDGLSDAEAISAYYDGTVAAEDRQPGTLSCGAVAHSEHGFEIHEVPLSGPEPGAVTLRHGTLRIEERPGNVDPVTYCLDVAGLTVAVTPGPDGFPTVVVTPQYHLTGVPLTLRVEDSAEGEVFERICMAS
ncbi:MAG TPA: hypothetical protein VFG15_03085 [Amycolatopsis sp.]|nr:hypothetical protein [Amycolatopsis sp.]